MKSINLPQVPTLEFVPSKQNMTTSTTFTATRNDESVEERHVRPRIIHGHGLVPYDRATKIPELMYQVDTENMMTENPERKRAIMDLQLIRIVSGSNCGQTNATSYQSFYKKNKKEGSMTSQFYILLLFRDVSSKEGQVVYIIENNNQNDKLWNKYTLLRDNGVVTIGTYITILNPLPITNWFYNQIPMIECRGGCIVNKQPEIVMEINIDRTIIKETTRSFVMNNATIRVLSTDVQSTKCGGYFCDRQRSIEISRGVKACGCYSMNSRIANIALVHGISVQKCGEVIMTMDDF